MGSFNSWYSLTTGEMRPSNDTHLCRAIGELGVLFLGFRHRVHILQRVSHLLWLPIGFASTREETEVAHSKASKELVHLE